MSESTFPPALADFAAKARARLGRLPGHRPVPMPEGLGGDDMVSPDGAYRIRRWAVGTPALALADVQEFHGQVAGVRVIAVPAPEHPAPILGIFAAVGPRGPLAAVADLSPVSAEGLPVDFRRLLVSPLRPDLPAVRELPDWAAVFSADCLSVTPQDEAQLDRFCAFAHTLLDGYLAVGASAVPLGSQRHQEYLSSWERYREVQMTEPGRRAVLTRVLGAPGADRHLREVLFPALA
ncbi:hypothetical protein [Streptomyces sp. NPDC058548]|uniref:hypothetical protein n=1 Tax=unclassified Streptomyces TaxID=2593676 RepID=UPI003651A0AB